jgi:hypothetical protein
MINANDFIGMFKNPSEKNILFGKMNTSKKLVFDGDTTASKKQFACINDAPGVGDRVAVYKQGQSYIILGVVDSTGRSSDNTKCTYTDGKITKFEEFDNTTLVKTTNFAYNTNGDIETIQEIAGGKTTTTTMIYTDGVLTSTTKVVV